MVPGTNASDKSMGNCVRKKVKKKDFENLDSSTISFKLLSSPSYFVTPSVPNRVFKMNKKIRILLIVRDPLTRLISDYTQILHNHMEKNLVFKPFRALAFNPDGSVNLQYDALLRSLYVNFLPMWLEFFPMSQIHVVNGEKLIKKPWHEV